MKRGIAFVLLTSLIAWNIPAFALSENDSMYLRDTRQQAEEPNVPKWTDYVPKKYENPRTDFSKKAATHELIWGVVLTDLIITCPIGIPMICHSTTKFKNASYAARKEIFFNGLEEAKTLPESERQAYYNNLLKQCRLKKKYID